MTTAAVYNRGFDLTAVVENVGDVAATRDVTLSVDGEQRRAVSVDLDGAQVEPVEFTDVGTFGLEQGATYAIDVDSGDDTASASLAVEDRSWPGSVGLETVATGFPDRPVAVETAPGSDRLYVVDRSVGVFVYEDGELREEPFLDISEDLHTEHREDGVMGLAFHPEFEENRRCFVTYTAPVREGTPESYNNTGVLAEFEVSEDGLTADRDSERTVLEVPSPDDWHNITNVDFGPDGYLYVAVGDGGAANDQGHDHADDWNDDIPGGDAQAVEENLLGTIVRIDVDGEPTEHPRTDPNAPDEPTGEEGYAIPEDNPLIGQEGYDEAYAWGLRSPWGAHFDGEDYYVADVGQHTWEYVNLIEKGGNYGWNVREGSHCCTSCGYADPHDCPDSTPEDIRGGEPLLDPIIEYAHHGNDAVDWLSLGICVIGGAVYRGDAIPGLEGQYVFADLQYDGRLFVANPDDGAGGFWGISALPIRDEDAGKIDQILAFGVDSAGELLVMGNFGDAGNSLHRIVPAE